MDRRDWLKISGALGAGILLPKIHMEDPMIQPSFTRKDFGNDFEWGVASAAYQIEGAFEEDGKGLSVWDTFTRKKGAVKDSSNGDVACDFYHRYESDLEILKSLSIPNFRFSLSWSRILPEGKGKINQKGIDFYNRVIDTCLSKGIEPWVTLFHWDTPQALEDKGGWTNRDMVNWFSDYVDVASKAFGDRVKNWMVLNEPMAFIGVGYMMGIHAPGRKGIGNFLPAAHHAAMCQAEGGRILRANLPDVNIGSTFSASWIDPWKDQPRHERAAARADALINRFFLDPVLGLGYPMDAIPPLKRIEKYFLEGDEAKLKFDFDFIGLQNYTREIIRHSLWPPIMWGKQVSAEKRKAERTEMGWEVYPKGIYHLLKKFAALPGVKKIIVTENGAAFPDELENGKIADTSRMKFIQDYLSEVLKAKKEGVPVEGYFIWSFTDNFEWAEGYRPRFGLVYIDYQNQRRVVKDSGIWYRDFLSGDE